MSEQNILGRLRTTCPFPSIFEKTESEQAFQEAGNRYKIAHIRADYDGSRWWNTVWPLHDELATPEMRKEVDDVYAALIASDAFINLMALQSYCWQHTEAQVGSRERGEFHFYLTGELCCYRLHCILCEKDYNLYLHAFLKPDKDCSKTQNYNFDLITGGVDVMNCQTVQCINGTLQVGDLVLSTPEDSFACLVGRVVEIAKLGTPQHETENTDDDVYVDFDGEYSPARIAEIEAMFSVLYQIEKRYEDLPLGGVIMAPDCLIRITDLSDDAVKLLLQSEANASGHCYRVVHALLQDAKGKHKN